MGPAPQSLLRLILEHSLFEINKMDIHRVAGSSGLPVGLGEHEPPEDVNVGE